MALTTEKLTASTRSPSCWRKGRNARGITKEAK